MESISTHIQKIVDELKSDLQAMEDVSMQTKVFQLERIINETQFKDASALGGEISDSERSFKALDSLTGLISELCKSVSQKESLLWLQHQLAITYRDMGNRQRAEALLEQNLSLTETSGCLDQLRAETFRQLGYLQFYAGEWAHAKAYYQKSLAIFSSHNDIGHAASIYNSLGYIAAQQGDYQTAKCRHQQAIAAGKQDIKGRRVLAGAYNSLGIIASIEADWEAALDYFEESITIYEEIGLLGQAVGGYMNLAMAYVDADELEAAGECYAHATALAEKAGNLLTLSKIYVNRAEFLLKVSNIDAARLYSNKALAIFEAIGDAIGIADVYKLHGRIHRHNKAWDDAIDAFTQSLERYRSCQNPLGEAEGCFEFGLMYIDCQNPKQAHDLLTRSGMLYTKLGATDQIQRVEAELSSLKA